MHRPHLLLCSLWFAIPISTARAAPYNPPVDQAGPLKVQLVGPEELIGHNARFLVKIQLENRGDSPLSVRLETKVIDDWTVEPDKPMELAIPAKRTIEQSINVQPAPQSYSAHYPVHAIASFTHQGKRLTVHPILVLETKFPPPTRESAAVAWKPIVVRKNSRLALWQIPVRRSVIEVFGREPFLMPVGHLGSEPRSRADVSLTTQTLTNDARSAIAMHPPWNDGNVGTIALEYPLALPAEQSVELQFANAMSPGGQSDGVTFRVRVSDAQDDALFGDIVYERHTEAESWQAAAVDLSRFAGQTIRLQLESHPGPDKNTGWDRCFWAEPTLVIGRPPAALPFPPTSEAGSQMIGEIDARQGDRYRVRFWAGARGLLDAVVGISDGHEELFFQGFEVTVHEARLDQSTCPLPLTRVSSEAVEGGVRFLHTFEGPEGPFDLVGALRVQAVGLQVEFSIENAPAPQPWVVTRLEDVSVGPWSRQLQRVYAGAGNVLERPGAFQLRFDGHRLSTSVVGYDFEDSFSLIESTSTPPLRLDIRPSQRHASLHATDPQVRTLVPAKNVWSALRRWRSMDRPSASAGVDKVAGRFVFDLWGGEYGRSGDELRRAFRYGLTDSMVVWHNWQRWGYDYRLPEIYPPNPQYGTEEELKAMIDGCRQADVLFALHDNYIDYYPDAKGFSYQTKIAFHRNGNPVLAWLNEGRGARAYRYRSDSVEPILQKNLRTIQQHLAPTAYFIDVWSSTRPYEYWTADGKYYGTTYSRDSWGKHFAWIREHMGNHAPQISESGHDQLIGWLDGAQTNHLRVGQPLPGRYTWSVWDWDCDDAERVAWFDAAHHDRFVLHGAGYEGRYVAGLDQRLHGMYSDDYIVTEMMTGHPAMVSRPFGPDVVRKYWLTQGVARALALQTIDHVDFVQDNIHRQCITWSNGQVWVNRGESDWDVAGTKLPQYGFIAKLQGPKGAISAAIERREGVIVERSESSEACYFNARSPRAQGLPIELTVNEAHYQDDRRVDLKLQWKLGVPIPDGWVPFLHFCDENREIVFQASHQLLEGQSLGAGETNAMARCWIPEQRRGGESFEMCVGVYNPKSGARLMLTGPDVGDRRIRVGSLRLNGDGSRISGVTWVPFEPTQDPASLRQNLENRPIDFGTVITSSGCRLTCESDQLVITPLPSARPVTFDMAIRWSELPWRLPIPRSIEAVDEEGKVLTRRPVDLEQDRLLLRITGGAFAFRLTP